MFCGSCGKEIADQSKFCYLCGTRQAGVESPAPEVSESPDSGASGARRLRRSTTDKVFGGVCGGLGEYFDIDPVLVRVAWAVVAIAGGVGILAYIICWLVIDEARSGAPAAAPRPIIAQPEGVRRLRRSATDTKWAGVCGGIAAHMGLDSTVVRLIWALLTVATGIVPGLITYVVMWIVMPAAEPAASGQPVAHSS